MRKRTRGWGRGGGKGVSEKGRKGGVRGGIWPQSWRGRGGEEVGEILPEGKRMGDERDKEEGKLHEGEEEDKENWRKF